MQMGDVFKQQSVACHLRVATVRQGENTLVELLSMVIVTLVPQQASKATGMSKAQGEPHSTVWFVPQVSTGGVVSIMVTTSVQVAVLVQQSWASQVIAKV